MTKKEALNLTPGTLVRLVGNDLNLTGFEDEFTKGKIYKIKFIDNDLWISHKTNNGKINGYKYIHYEVVPTIPKSQKQHILDLIKSI